MQNSRRLMAIFALALLTGCSPKTPEHSQASSPAAKTAAKATPTMATSAVDQEEVTDTPATEAAMLSQFEALIIPPPVGPNGETRVFHSDSTTANAITGDITVSTSKKNQDPDTNTQTMYVRTATGLVYELHNVPAGGVDAIGALDWSKIMDTPVGMETFLKKGGELPNTLVFVYRVVQETVPASAPNGGFCGPKKTGYLAFTIPESGSTADHPLSIAAFGEGAWPPKDATTMCGTYHYAAGS